MSHAQREKKEALFADILDADTGKAIKAPLDPIEAELAAEKLAKQEKKRAKRRAKLEEGGEAGPRQFLSSATSPEVVVLTSYIFHPHHPPAGELDLDAAEGEQEDEIDALFKNKDPASTKVLLCGQYSLQVCP